MKNINTARFFLRSLFKGVAIGVALSIVGASFSVMPIQWLAALFICLLVSNWDLFDPIDEVHK